MHHIPWARGFCMAMPARLYQVLRTLLLESHAVHLVVSNKGCHLPRCACCRNVRLQAAAAVIYWVLSAAVEGQTWLDVELSDTLEYCLTRVYPVHAYAPLCNQRWHLIGASHLIRCLAPDSVGVRLAHEIDSIQYSHQRCWRANLSSINWLFLVKDALLCMV